jgi:glycosyltransferase involved in cell wall biosynthesis
MSTPTFTVAICTYTADRWSDLVAAVRSTAEQTPRPADQVIVIVDHNDLLLARARRELAGVDVHPNAGRRGLSGARNTAIAHARGDVLCFLDDDAEAAPDWLARLRPHYADDGVLGVGGWAEPAWDDRQPRWFPDEFLWVVGCSHRGLPTETAPVRNPIGCNMSIRADVLRRVGGFDDELGRTADRPLGCEETDLCIRAGAAFTGGRFLLEPRARVRHRVPRSRTTLGYFLARCRAEGVSKSWVAGRVGSAAATATERRYVTRTLPFAVAGGLVDAVRGDPSGVARAGAVVVGLAATTAEYAVRRLARRRGVALQADGLIAPLATFVIDRDRELPTLTRGRSAAGVAYRAAHCLVFEHEKPAGVVVVPFLGDVITAATLGAAIENELGPADVAVDASPGVPIDHPDPISVVIATRDRPDLIVRCVRSILAASVQPLDVIVVDNAPSDGTTAAAVRTLADAHPNVRYVLEPRAGLAVAHNAGLAHVTTPTVAFTDDDVVVDDHWLAAIGSAMAVDPDVVCVTGMIAPLELETPTQCRIETASVFNKGFRREVFSPDDRHRGPLYPYAAGVFGSGANMAFRTGYLRAAAGFDDALGAGTLTKGGDDLAAFFDVITSGHRLVYEPAALVRHQHHREPSALGRQAFGYGAGLTAHLTRCVVNDRRALVDFARAAFAGLRRAREIARPGTASIQSAGVTGAAVRGMLSGPVRYLRARHGSRRARTDERRVA